MRISLSILILALATALEMTFLPALLGVNLPFLATAVLVGALAFAGGRDRFWVALGGGFVRDLLVLGSAFTYTRLALLLAVLLWFSDAIAPWEEPVGRIARLAIGFGAWPFLWVLIRGVGTSGGTEPLGGVFQAMLGRDILFSSLVLLSFSFVSLWRFRATGNGAGAGRL